MFIPEAMRLDPTWLDSDHAPSPGLAIIVKSNAQMNRSSLSGSYVTIRFAAIGIASTALSASALRTRVERVRLLLEERLSSLVRDTRMLSEQVP